MKHPYMSDEELELYHKHHEIVPFFHSRAEKAAWKQKKREEKLRREELRHLMKHKREMREIKEAYATLRDPLYDGDTDVEHLIETSRLQHRQARHEPVHTERIQDDDETDDADDYEEF